MNQAIIDALQFLTETHNRLAEGEVAHLVMSVLFIEPGSGNFKHQGINTGLELEPEMKKKIAVKLQKCIETL